jgi:hypothetical protein
MAPARPAYAHRTLYFLACPLLIVAGLLLFTVSAQIEPLSATYRHGTLSFTWHYHAENGGPGRLVAEILDPEGNSLGRVERAMKIEKGDGVFEETITPDKPIPFDDVMWQRLRYRFEYADKSIPALEGIESISQILRRPVVRVLGQQQYMAGSHAAIRVIVTDAASNSVLTGTVHIDLVVTGRDPLPLFSGALNRRGTVEAGFHLPAHLTGKCELRFQVDTPIGSTEYSQPIELADKASILLTTEKPIYQPGQTIHVRALALDRASHRAADARKLTFVIDDSRGNKVFRKATETDRFGVASAEFTLADEVNLGAYHLHALVGDPESPSDTADLTIQVDRYVLPKFKVEVEFDKKDNKPRRDYRPGDHVTGTVRATYFFGKPVDHADVTIKASGTDVAVFEAASEAGKTDDEGAFHFDLKLPKYFAGHPLSQGAARALIEATVKDSAAHAETRGEPITISESPLLITAIPEGGTLIPGIENQVFILTSYPDGSPARTALTVHAAPSVFRIGDSATDRKLSSDESGIAVYRINPGPGDASLKIDADDHRGNRASSTVALQSRNGSDQILLRTDRAIFKAGDPIQFAVISTRASGAAYVDVVKNGQTILTKDLDLQGGRAELTVTATPEMAGTLDIDAYLFGRDSQPVADHRLVFVQPADELKIESIADKATYLPGSEARVRFHVTNSHGQGVQAALGLQVVDEAVFALAEKQPGFAKVFFYLEEELMKPRYEIHSLSMDDVIERRDPVDEDAHDLSARALFSATEMTAPARLDVEFGRSLPEDKFDEYQDRYHAAFVDQVRQIAEKLSRQLSDHPESIVKAFSVLDNGSAPRDAWNEPLRIESAGPFWGRGHYFIVRSAGADRRFNTGDDLTIYIETHAGTVLKERAQGGSLDLRIEHDRGPMNDRAEVTGTMADATGATIADATITLRQLATADTRSAHGDANGGFDLAGLSPGRYRIEASSPGFMGISRELTLQARDRAILSVTLDVGAVTETVTVEAVAPPMPMAQAAIAFADAPAPVAARALGSVAARSFTLKKVVAQPEAPQEPHVRSYFPEALYINPEIVTDGNGDASISIPIADSITTWRMAMLASTQAGALGSGTSSLKVFQDFFVDLDLPVALTQGDRISIPVAIYNYTGGAGKVSLHLKQEDWFSLDDDVLDKTISVDAGRVGSSQFTVSAKHIGKFKLTLTAHLASAENRDDIVVREIEVIPNGREQDLVFNGRLENTVQHELKFQANAIPEATSIVVRFYPGPLSEIVEGMDSILSMPSGCFEQTSSSTYPNVLALDYMKRTKKLTPEIHAKAEGFIATGYQRLLTFEVPGGGFSWFGQAPANKILTAYGLMEFSDMSKVADVDPKLIERTSDWLASQQQADGSWKPDTSFINEGATNRYNSDVLRITAYVAWSLESSGYKGDAVEKAKHYIESANGPAPDAYTLAVLANFAADYGKDPEFTRRAMHALIDARTEKGDQVFWAAQETGVYSTGESAAIETTGLVTQALLKWGQASEIARKALAYISAHKQVSGTWGTTQATIMALRALLLATQLSASDVHGSLAILIDGKPAQTLNLTPENNDLLHQFVFKGIDPSNPSSVQLKFDGSGSLAYQVVGRYFTPYAAKPAAGPLSIEVAYDRTRLAQNDFVTATTTISNNLPKFANMVMVDLGIPPGFDLLSEDLQSFQEKSAGSKSGRLEKFSLTATQAILYFNALAPHQTVTIKVRLRAKYPIRARTFQSRVYEYYDPDVSAVARPETLEVAQR